MDEQKPKLEEYKVSGEDFMSRMKQLLHEGNVRRIIVKDTNGHTIAEFPLTAGVVGAVIAPPLAAIGAIAALVANMTVYIERTEQPGGGTPGAQPPAPPTGTGTSGETTQL